MPQFLIQRTIPNAGQMTPQQLHDVAAASNEVLHAMQRDGTPIQWVESFVSGDALTCVYIAPTAESIRDHARRGGFPCDQIINVSGKIGPLTGE